MRLITCADDIDEGLDVLKRGDPRLEEIHAVAGEVPLRLREPGFEGLARIVVSQQVSVQSAAAIWSRYIKAIDPNDAPALLETDEDLLRSVGLSAAKIKTLRGIGEAICSGALDLKQLGKMPANDAHDRLVALKGIGPWTADVFLMFCLGHADAFAAGDLALQQAACDAFKLEDRPKEKALLEIAEPWRPWRSVAARLLWAYYRARRQGLETLPV